MRRAISLFHRLQLGRLRLARELRDRIFHVGGRRLIDRPFVGQLQPAQLEFADRLVRPLADLLRSFVLRQGHADRGFRRFQIRVAGRLSPGHSSVRSPQSACGPGRRSRRRVPARRPAAPAVPSWRPVPSGRPVRAPGRARPRSASPRSCPVSTGRGGLRLPVHGWAACDAARHCRHARTYVHGHHVIADISSEDCIRRECVSAPIPGLRGTTHSRANSVRISLSP